MKKSATNFIFCAALLLYVYDAYAQQPPDPPSPAHQPSATQQEPVTQFPHGSANRNAITTYNIIEAANNSWCYDVYVDGRLMIHQTSIPGLPGNEGFKT